MADATWSYLGCLLAVPVLAAALHHRTRTASIVAATLLAALASANLLVSMRLPLDSLDVWYGVFFGVVLPVSCGLLLPRLLSPEASRWKPVLAAIVCYFAALFIGTRIGSALGAVFQ
jgi:membrane-bound metal-dependent hydrolase YbcI (DUF457 family)